MTIEIFLTILSILIGTGVSIALYKFNNKRQAENKFKNSPKAKILFYDNELIEDTIYDIDYCVNLNQFNKNNIMLYYHFPISIRNTGNVSLENIHISFKFKPKSPLPIEDKWVGFNNPISDNILSRKHSKQDRRTTITYTIKYLNPKVRYDIGEIFHLSETKLEFSHKLPNKGEAFIEADFSHKIEMLFEARNLIPQKFTFNLRLCNINEKSDCMNRINKEYEKLTLHEKYEYCKNKKIYFFFPEIKELGNKNGITLNCGMVYSENIKFLDIEPEVVRANRNN